MSGSRTEEMKTNSVEHSPCVAHCHSGVQGNRTLHEYVHEGPWRDENTQKALVGNSEGRAIAGRHRCA
jgi:hypothetical protein